MKHYSTQELLSISSKAPLLVQEALSSETTIMTIANVGTKLKLHIDQIGLIAELNVQMLLGLVGPQEFLQELLAAGISDKDTREIMTEINQKIFMPLREQMQDEPVEQKTTQAQPAPKQTVQPPVSAVPKEGLVRSAPQPAPLINLLRTPPSAPTPPISQIQQPAPSVSQRLPANERPYSVDPYREPLDDK